MAERGTSKGVKSAQNPQTRDPNAVVRVDLAIKLRATKMKYEDIAKQCGFPSANACRKAVMRELDRVIVKDVEILRTEEMDSLERLELECWKIFSDKEYAKGRLFAVDRILQIKERRSKLMGLDKRSEEDLLNQNYTKKIVLMPGGQDANPNN